MSVYEYASLASLKNEIIATPLVHIKVDATDANAASGQGVALHKQPLHARRAS